MSCESNRIRVPLLKRNVTFSPV